jgi:hypothetical protein
VIATQQVMLWKTEAGNQQRLSFDKLRHRYSFSARGQDDN